MIKRTKSAGSSIVKAPIALIAAVAIILFLYWYTRHREIETSPEKVKFYNERITPILDANASANTRALEAMKSEIHSQFEQYRKRVPAFTDDITSFSNKLKITWEATKQMASDEKDKVKRHVTGKFEMHVVSAEKMQKDLERIVHAFRMDVEANKNRMLVEIEAAVKNDPRFSAEGAEISKDFQKKIEKEISEASVQAGKDAVVLSSMTFLVAFATEEAVRHLVVAALTRVGTSLAASMGTAAAASGGATVAGGAGGGGAGSLGGPAGAVIGFAAGITVGLIVDHVMTERMVAKLNTECTSFLTKAEKEITTAPDGPVSTLEKALAEIERAERTIIKKQIHTLP